MRVTSSKQAARELSLASFTADLYNLYISARVASEEKGGLLVVLFWPIIQLVFWDSIQQPSTFTATSSKPETSLMHWTQDNHPSIWSIRYLQQLISDISTGFSKYDWTHCKNNFAQPDSQPQGRPANNTGNGFTITIVVWIEIPFILLKYVQTG